MLKIPVMPGSPPIWIIDKCEMQEGVFIASSLTEVVDGYVMTTILNSNDREVEMQEPLLDEVDPAWDISHSTLLRPQDQEREILVQLRLEHLNAVEEKLLVLTCLDYQDIFCIPVDKLSRMGAAQHSICVEPGTEPFTTRPYRLPENKRGR
jgi:hypothetical protein